MFFLVTESIQDDDDYVMMRMMMAITFLLVFVATCLLLLPFSSYQSLLFCLRIIVGIMNLIWVLGPLGFVAV